MATNSFIANVNLLVDKLQSILLANDLFDEDVIPILREIADLDLQEAIDDLKKSNYLGNRKVDINLLYNMVGVDENTPQDEAEAIWLNPSKTVRYDKATVMFTDGTTHVVEFTFDGNPTTISTHADLMVQFNNDTEFLAKLNNTLLNTFSAPVVGEFIRFYDVIGSASNIERITLSAVSGEYKEANPMYYWIKTTSALQTLSNRVGDIIKLGNEIDNFISIANNVDQLLELQSKIPELVDTYTEGVPNGDATIYNKLDELMELYDNLSGLLALFNDLEVINTMYDNLDNILNVNTSLAGVTTVADSIINVNIVGDNISNVNTVGSNNSNINAIVNDVIPNMLDILNADDNAQLAKEYAIKTNGEVETNTFSAKEYAIGDRTDTGGSAKAWAIDPSSPDGSSSKSAKTYSEEAGYFANIANDAAILATEKADEIKAVTVGSTTTAVPSTPASVIYNAGTGQFHFIIPKGDKGDKGDAFTVNAIGLFADRDTYDGQPQNFSFLATDTGNLYFKNSNTSGDWSSAIPFGKGEKGDDGDDGRGIVNVEFVSSSLGGAAGQLGAIDTYRVNYTDSTNDTFIVRNGNPTPTNIPAANIDQTVNYRFVTDAEKSVWNAKQDALSVPTQAEAEAGTATIARAWTAQRVKQAVTTNFVNQGSIVYVSKSGNSSFNGLNPNTPKPTIGEAVTVANTLISDGASRVAIEIVDSGIYTENVALPSNILLYGTNAVLEGSLTINTGCYVTLYGHYPSANNQVMLTKLGASHSYYKVVVSDARGILANRTGCTNVRNYVTSSILFLDIELMFVNYEGISEVTSSGNGHIHVDIRDIYITANNATGINGTGDESDIIGYVDHILLLGTLTGTRAIRLNSANGNINLVSTEIIGNTALLLTAGTMNIVCPSIVGTRTITGGTFNVNNAELLNGKKQGTDIGDIVVQGDTYVNSSGISVFSPSVLIDGGSNSGLWGFESEILPYNTHTLVNLQGGAYYNGKYKPFFIHFVIKVVAAGVEIHGFLKSDEKIPFRMFTKDTENRVKVLFNLSTTFMYPIVNISSIVLHGTISDKNGLLNWTTTTDDVGYTEVIPPRANSLMNVGDFGYGGGVTKVAVDLNSAITSERFQYTSDSANNPSANFGFIDVQTNSTGTYVIQDATDAVTGMKYWRASSNSGATWSSWKEYVEKGTIQTLTNKTLEAVRVTEKAFTATGTSGTITINCANGNKATVTPTGNITSWSFTNVPSSGNSYILNIQITGSGTVRSVAYPTSIKWKDDEVPEINWTSGRKTFIILETSDGGTSWEGRW